MAEQVRQGPTHSEIIDELMGVSTMKRLLDPQERAVDLHNHIAAFAHLYGIEATMKAIGTGLQLFMYDAMKGGPVTWQRQHRNG